MRLEQLLKDRRVGKFSFPLKTALALNENMLDCLLRSVYPMSITRDMDGNYDWTCMCDLFDKMGPNEIPPSYNISFEQKAKTTFLLKVQRI